MINAILMLLPSETWVLVLMAAGILMIIGCRKLALGLAGTVILLALLSPFINALMNTLPTWILIVIMLFCGLSLLRLFLGAHVVDCLIAHALYDLLRCPFKILGWLLWGSRRRF